MSQNPEIPAAPKPPLEPKAVRDYHAFLYATIGDIISPRSVRSISREMVREIEAFLLNCELRHNDRKEAAAQATRIAAMLVPNEALDARRYQIEITDRILTANAGRLIYYKRTADDAMKERALIAQAPAEAQAPADIPTLVVEQPKIAGERHALFAPRRWDRFLTTMDEAFNGKKTETDRLR